MNIWKTLGLDGPTDDLKTVKRAYAARLKVTRPEDDPQGFMELREALDRATAYARNHTPAAVRPSTTEPPARTPEAEKPVHKAKPPEVVRRAQPLASPPPASAESETFDKPPTPESPAPEETQNAPPIYITAGEDAPADVTPELEPELEPKPEPPASPATLMIHRLHDMMANPFRRSEKEAWAEIFEDPSIEPLEDWIEFDHRLRDYLLQIFGAYDGDAAAHNRNRKPRLISTRIGTYIFDRMDWHDYQGHAGIADELAWLKEDLDVIAPRGAVATPQPQPFADSAQESDFHWGNILWVIIGLGALARLIGGDYF